jgi:hypothetical protein
MSTVAACPICGTPRPADRASVERWCCSIPCYNQFWGIDQPAPPSCHDPVTTPCPACGRPFTPVGRQAYCSGACRAAAYRRRRDRRRDAPVVPVARPRPPITVYECDSCGQRALGEQRCDECNTWMRRIGVGGSCPSCDEPIALEELLTSNP